LQQQVLDPSSAAATSSTDGGAALSTGSGGSAVSTDFATELANAQAASSTATATGLDGADSATADQSDPAVNALSSGLASTAPDPLASVLSSTGTDSADSGLSAAAADPLSSGVASGVAPLTAATTASAAPQVQAMVDAANSLVGKPYVWGGGHSGWGPQAGYDCSGFVSAVLHAGGYLSTPQDTVTLPSAAGIASGPGQYVTIYDRNAPGQEGHVIIDIAGQFYESGGESGPWGGGGGVEKIATPSAAYLATFNDILHPEGL